MKHFSVLLLVIAMSAGAIVPASISAVQSGVTFTISTIANPEQTSVTSVCYTLIDGSNEGCDENGDGDVVFQDVTPGTYTVEQRNTDANSDLLPVGDFEVTITDDADQGFAVLTYPGSGDTSPVDVTVSPVTSDTGDSISGMCFIFEGGSKEGCDENNDGTITYQDMNPGSYLLVQSEDVEGLITAAPVWVAVDQDSTEFLREIQPVNAGSDEGEVADIALVTRDPDSSDLVTGTCYVLVDFSNEGCDENNDGRVTFEDVPTGTYTVEQTQPPDGYDTARDFTIEVVSGFPEQGILVKQARDQNQPDTRNVSILLIDGQTGELVTDSGVCLTLGTKTNVGCDDNNDGQIDFLDVDLGSYPINIEDGPTDGGHISGSGFAVSVDDVDSTNVIGTVVIAY